MQKQRWKFAPKNIQIPFTQKSEPIARKTIFLKKKFGGLNLIESEAHNFLMRIKHLLQLKQNHNLLPWKCLATYWLAKDNHKFSQEYQFLMSNSRTKALNQKKFILSPRHNKTSSKTKIKRLWKQKQNYLPKSNPRKVKPTHYNRRNPIEKTYT